MQREACERLAVLHGVEIESWVELPGVSGAAVLKDARFAALLDRLEEPAVAGVIVREFSRLMRPESMADFRILEAFRCSGKILYTPEGALDFRNPDHRLLGLLRGWMSDSERSLIRDRLRDGRERKRRLGRRAEGPVGLPRGVTFEREAGWRYVEPEASRVREVFRLYLSGLGNLREIARATGLARGRASNGLTSSVLSVLRQPLYMGIYRVDRRWKDGSPTPRPPEDCHEHVVLDPPLVDPADWHRAQDLLARRAATRPVRRQRGDLGLYHGHLDCARCGAELWIHPPHPRGGAAAYVCGNRRARGCEAAGVSVRVADPLIDSALETRLGDIATLHRLIEAAAAESAQRRRSPALEATRRLSELHNRRARVLDAIEAGLYDVREAGKRLANIDGERSALEDLLGREDGPVEIVPAVVAAIVRVFASWRSLARGERRELLAAYRIRVALRTVAPRVPPTIESVLIGLLGESRDGVRIYKD